MISANSSESRPGPLARRRDTSATARGMAATGEDEEDAGPGETAELTAQLRDPGRDRTDKDALMMILISSDSLTQANRCSYSPSVSGMTWSGWFEAGREPGVAVEQVAEGVEFADAPFSGGGQVGLD